MSQFPISRITPSLIVAGLLVFAGTALAQAKPASTADEGLAVDLTVNGRPISRNHITLMGANFTEDRQSPGPEAQAAARAELITQEVLAQAALKEGLDKKAVIADQIAFQQRAILSRAYLEDYFVKHPVTDDTLKTAYDFSVAGGKLSEYKVRHILVNALPKAEAIAARLARGEDFVAVAKVETLDPGGQNTGGDLGWFRPDIFIDANFAKAVQGLKKGETTKLPVRSRFGWHLIKLEDGPRPVANARKWEQLDEPIKQALRQRAAQARLEGLTESLTAKAKIAGPGLAAAPAATGKTRSAP